jgi:preprotein translocase SecE subunit
MVRMAFGLYKPGQGYWVRVVTATLSGVLILAASAWLWTQLQGAGGLIPRPTSTFTVAGPAGAAAPGQSLALLAEAPRPSVPPVVIGTAVVRESHTLANGSEAVTLGSFDMKAGRSPRDAGGVGPLPEGGGATLTGSVVARADHPIFDPLYLQAGGVGLLMLVGAIVVYWLVGVKPQTSEFLIATDGEMKKVNWSSRKDVIGSTWVVILWSVLIAAGLYVVDFVFATFFKAIGVLQ